ncbi:hypothetical protein [Kingella kingae]|uniref:hypothetical protein n=1 Tax=Kingella kingae TaxID=504 RepID=UPI000405761A|nr:hypothetical protein [Kingella kingae]MDK4536846.1 hypothetical protein [Kingella kingae]MDK4539292.1 hypothetical protein [Kingella kingae]MDK4547274.1 hypothetical protein [Kingella kingae]MDK4564559.1 hypothetical protein [Kingella kingae]MDK4578804.1 hypothetical protein [Kingella kingae]
MRDKKPYVQAAFLWVQAALLLWCVIKYVLFTSSNKEIAVNKWIALALAACTLTACTWETYDTADGGTSLRQKYPTGTSVYCTNGAASQNTNYHANRPQPHAIVPQTDE